LTLVITFLALLLLGVPVALVLAGAGLVYLMFSGTALTVAPQRMFVAADDFTLMALPLFILAGDRMNEACIPQRLVLVAVLPDGRVVGWIQVHRVVFLGGAPFTEIGGLVVDETCRRMGIGRALVRAAEEWTLQHGMVDVSVRSNIIRDGAHAFYRQLGYRLVKTQYTFHKELIG